MQSKQLKGSEECCAAGLVGGMLEGPWSVCPLEGSNWTLLTTDPPVSCTRSRATRSDQSSKSLASLLKFFQKVSHLASAYCSPNVGLPKNGQWTLDGKSVFSTLQNSLDSSFHIVHTSVFVYHLAVKQAMISMVSRPIYVRSHARV